MEGSDKAESAVMNSAPLPFAGLRVLDLTRVVAGPFAAQMLGDFGAEVIRVTRPREGDVTRNTPPFLKDREGRDTRESALYLSCNRNKKSVAIDISRAEGQEIVRRLVAISDVVIENYKVGDLARYRLDYASLSALNPALIYCSITGFGQTGPYRTRPGYDSMFQAYSGMMSLTGQPDGAPGEGPIKTGPSFADIGGGLYAAFAVVTALYQRKATGRGQHIDIGLLDTTVALIGHLGMQYLIAGLQPPRMGSGTMNITAASNVYRCADGIIMITASPDGEFRRLCQVLGRPDLLSDERFAKQLARTRHRGLVEAELMKLIGPWKRDALLDALDKAAVPAAPVNDLAQAFNNPQVKSREMVVEVPHPLSGTVKLVANPIRFSDMPVSGYTSPPLLDEHTEQVLSGLLGMGADEIKRLRDEAVL